MCEAVVVMTASVEFFGSESSRMRGHRDMDRALDSTTGPTGTVLMLVMVEQDFMSRYIMCEP